MLYIYTDGSVTRPTEGSGPGGWAFSFYLDGRSFREAGGCRNVTNNQMEMLAAIKGMECLIKIGFNTWEPICLVSDSQYVVHGATKWLHSWKRKNWVNSQGRHIKNRSLWEKIDALNHKLNVQYKWIRGHNGNPENEVCDKLAREAAFRAEGMILASQMNFPEFSGLACEEME